MSCCDAVYMLEAEKLELANQLETAIKDNGILQNNVAVFRDEKNLAFKRWSELSELNAHQNNRIAQLESAIRELNNDMQTLGLTDRTAIRQVVEYWKSELPNLMEQAK